MKRWIPILLTTTVISACGTIRNYARWPYQGPMLLVTNPTSERLIVKARDGQGREWVTARLKANGRQCFRWPFIHEVGYLIATGADTVMTKAFEPWSADGWEWSGQVEPVSNPKVCR